MEQEGGAISYRIKLPKFKNPIIAYFVSLSVVIGRNVQEC